MPVDLAQVLGNLDARRLDAIIIVVIALVCNFRRRGSTESSNGSSLVFFAFTARNLDAFVAARHLRDAPIKGRHAADATGLFRGACFGRGGLFAQGLARLFQTPGQANVVPQPGGRVAPQKARGGIRVVQHQVDNVARQQHLFLFGERPVMHLVGGDEVAKVNVARVAIAAVAASAQDVIVVGDGARCCWCRYCRRRKGG